MKTALVTGGARGIGKAECRALARDGFIVYINYAASKEAAEALAGEIGGRAVKADLRSSEEVAAMFKEIGEVDVVVNNAGIWTPGLVQDIPDETWEDLFNVNTEGTFRVCRGALPSMIQKKAGCIINTASIWGVRGASYEAAYSATKGAIITFTRALAKEVGPSGIRVNCVCPGVIATDMCASYTKEEMDALAADTPLGRIGRAEDVAELVAFLASDKASFITGEAIACDGGFAL